MVPEHVLTAFNQTVPADSTSLVLGPEWDYGTLLGSVVYAPASDTSLWSANVRQKIQVPGVRLARPIRSSDGRFVVSGWKASSFIDGRAQWRVDETVLAALRLSDKLVDVVSPSSVERNDIYADAEIAAWAECDELYGELPGPNQPGHADMLATTIFDGTAMPAVTDVVPFAHPRPRAMTAALVIADAMIMQAASGIDVRILSRFGHIQNLEPLVLRGVVYREHVNKRHQAANSLTCSNIGEVRALLVSRLSDTM